MHLGFGFFSSFFFLSQFSLYVIVLFLILGMLLEGAKFNGLSISAASYLAHRSSRDSWTLLVGIFFLFLALPLLLLRSPELSNFSGSLSVTLFSYKWLFFVYLVGAVVIFFLATLTPIKFSSAFVEFFVGSFLLIQVWAWISLQTNWLAVLLFLEIGALILLLFGAYAFNAGLTGSSHAIKSSETSHNTDFNFLKFFIFFLWLSVTATFFFFWALALSYSSWLGFDLHSMYLLNAYVWGQSGSGSYSLGFFMVFLGLGFLFKLLLIPLQGVLLSLYGVFSFGLFLLYLVLYYFFFLFTAFLSFGLIFYVFWGGWAFIITWLGLFALFSLLFCLSIESDFRQVFATSSIVNLTLAFLFVL